MNGSSGAIVLALAGLLGAAGVALGAAAAHRINDPSLATAAHLAMIHAAAVVAVVSVSRFAPRPLTWTIASGLLLCGAALFVADIALRSFTGQRLFPYAAPLGGSTMIAGWLSVAVAAILGRRGGRA